MLKDKKNWVILILLALTIYLCFLIFQGRKKSQGLLPSDTVIITDTIYLPPKEYQEVKPYKDSQIPHKIIIYRDPDLGDTENDSDRTNLLSNQSILHYDSLSPNLGPSLYDSISQILIKNNWLELTTKNTLDSTYKIRKFKIDPNQYNYNWVNNELTYKKKLNLKLIPYISGSYRPFNKFTDLNAGLVLETKKFNYNLGLNLFYYPSLQKSVGKDLQISITYKFR